jgi:pimeloyl-ACP methyl ester carboxylesterase
VLISAAAPDAKMPLEHARAAQSALDRVFQQCAADTACASAYPQLKREWTDVLERLARAPIRVPRPGANGVAKEVEIRRDVFGEAFRGILGGRPWDVPFVIHGMARGDFGPFLDRLSLDESSPLAEGLYLSVVCAEGTARITDADAAAAAQGTFLGDYRVSQQRRACAEWPHAKLDASQLEAPHSATPVLFVNGTADYVTPPQVAERLASHLARSRVVLIDGLPHFPSGLSHMDCHTRLINAFFEDPDPARLDTSCIATMKPPPFRTAPDPR